MSVLENILLHKRKEISDVKRRTSLLELTDRALFATPRISLVNALIDKAPAIIAEVKKASPSQGIIREDFDPVAIAQAYVQGGASAISVLTDEQFFKGHIEFIERMRSEIPIPILRKDFIIDAYQLYEAKAYGADAVLLIAAALERQMIVDLVDEAKEIGLECLVEVHSAEEIEKLDFSRVGLVGINNRDLATFKTDIRTSASLRKLIPDGVVVVSESAIKAADDVRFLMENGISAFLVGESLMCQKDPGIALADLLRQTRQLLV